MGLLQENLVLSTDLINVNWPSYGVSEAEVSSVFVRANN